MASANSEVLEVANQAFQYFSQGLATGNWQPFLDMLTEDFTFWFPVGLYQGVNTGKDRAASFFRYVSEAFSEGLTVTVERVTSNDTTVVFEIHSEGRLRGKPYSNQVAVSLDVRGHQICGYREYLSVIVPPSGK